MTLLELKEKVRNNPDNYEFDEDDILSVEVAFDDVDLSLEDAANGYDDLKDYIEENVSFDDYYDVEHYNDYVDRNYYDEHLYSMDELDDVMSNMRPSEILDGVDKDFSMRDDYFYSTIYGYKSTSDVSEVIDDVIGERTFNKYLLEEEFSELTDNYAEEIFKALKEE